MHQNSYSAGGGYDAAPGHLVGWGDSPPRRRPWRRHLRDSADTTAASFSTY